METADKKLLTYATAYNALRALAALFYGTDEDFVRDVLPQCIESGIISAHAASDSIWQENNIAIEDVKNPKCMEYNNPWKGLCYSINLK